MNNQFIESTKEKIRDLQRIVDFYVERGSFNFDIDKYVNDILMNKTFSLSFDNNNDLKMFIDKKITIINNEVTYLRLEMLKVSRSHGISIESIRFEKDVKNELIKFLGYCVPVNPFIFYQLFKELKDNKIRNLNDWENQYFKNNVIRN